MGCKDNQQPIPLRFEISRSATHDHRTDGRRLGHAKNSTAYRATFAHSARYDHANRTAHRSLEHRNYRNVVVSRSEMALNAAMRYSESDGGIWALAIAGPVFSQQICVAQAARAKKTNR